MYFTESSERHFGDYYPTEDTICWPSLVDYLCWFNCWIPVIPRSSAQQYLIICFPINWHDQSCRVTRRCSGNVTLRADRRLSTGCHCTPCARAPASQTDQRDWGCTSAPVTPLELRFQPCPPQGTEHSELPGIIKAKLIRSESRAEQTVRGTGHVPKEREPGIIRGTGTSAGLGLPPSAPPSAGLPQPCSTRQHRGRAGSCLESLDEEILGKFFFLRAVAMYRKG